MTGPLVDVPVRRPPDVKNLHRQVRFFADMSWLWQQEYIM